jgi:hypothetical protein
LEFTEGQLVLLYDSKKKDKVEKLSRLFEVLSIKKQGQLNHYSRRVRSRTDLYRCMHACRESASIISLSACQREDGKPSIKVNADNEMCLRFFV